ncbi:MAG TPA: TMEM165/GDT1 family protein [Ilumatobacter sp.]|nr:TMEM165/GDT1 family protein [Ilumatobacter sp.]
MWQLLVAAASAFGVVFLAELGDKTQLLAMGFGARYSLRVVAVGLLIGFGIAGAFASVVGGVLGAALPERPIAIGGGVLFLGFAAWTLWEELKGDDHDEAVDVTVAAVSTRTAIWSIAGSIIVGELGDKTQLATAALAAKNNPFMTWVGGTAGLVSVGMIGAVAGNRIGTRLNGRVIAFASAALFALFGVLLIVSA